MKNDKVVLITGGTGFIGSRLAKRLISDGYIVHLIVRERSNLEQIRPFLTDLKCHNYDGSIPNLVEIVNTVKPGTVFHLASLFIAEHRTDQVDSLIESNILFGTQLLEGMRQSNIRRFINVGTSWQHYHSEQEHPSCLYAATKLAFQDILKFYTDAYGLRSITLKLFDTYGPGDPRGKLFSLLRNAYLKGQTLAMSGGEQMIDLVYIDDIIEAFKVTEARIHSSDESMYESFGVSSANPLPLRQVVELYNTIIKSNLQIYWGNRPYRIREVMQPWSGNPVLPGWCPKISLAEGMHRLHMADHQCTL